MFESFLKPSLSFPTLTGSIVTFNSQYAGLPLKSHTVAVTATQSGSGTPSPDNVRNINGYSAINISHSDADTSSPTVYTIQIGSTVYGGEYDARTGLLTVTHVLFSLDNTSNWQEYESGKYYVDDVFTRYSLGNVNIDTPISNMYDFSGNGASGSGDIRTDHKFYMRNQLGRVWVYDSDYATLNDFKTMLSSNALQVCYPLATPTTIQLPPCPIDTLEGVNNIWADTGDTTLQYIKLG